MPWPKLLRQLWLLKMILRTYMQCGCALTSASHLRGDDQWCQLQRVVETSQPS
jgi:hypothetical protein